jgi:ATP-dependent helicase HrpB
LNWTPEAEQLRLRLYCAAQWLPEADWPAVDDASLLASLEAWLLPQMTGVHSLRALKAVDLRQALQNWLPWTLRPQYSRRRSCSASGVQFNTPSPLSRIPLSIA